MALAFIRYKIVLWYIVFCSEVGRGGSPTTECTEMALVKQVHSLWQGICQAPTGFRTTDEKNLLLTKTEDVLALTEKKWRKGKEIKKKKNQGPKVVIQKPPSIKKSSYFVNKLTLITQEILLSILLL